MHHRMRTDLSCCHVDGNLIFLDMARDRYFRLDPLHEHAMQSFLAHRQLPPPMTEALIAAEILEEVACDSMDSTVNAPAPRMARSAMEQIQLNGAGGTTMMVIVEVSTIVWSMHRRLKKRSLKECLGGTAAYRTAKVRPGTRMELGALQHDLLLASRQFIDARRFVPIEPSCLLDSLSLLRFLARRGLPADIVLGVTAKPFAAHCWAQAGDLVLNETLSGAQAYAPIKVI